MRKSVATLLSVALLFSLISFTSAAATTSSDGIDRTKKIALLFDAGGPGDGSFNDASRFALKKAIAKYKLATPYVRELVTDGTLGDRIYRLRLMARNGYSLMIGVGSANAEAIRRVSLEYPELEYAVLNDGTVSGINVASLVFDDRQAAYMAGFVAALTSRTKRVLFVAKDEVELDRISPFFERGVSAAKVRGVQSRASHVGLGYVPLLDAPFATTSGEPSSGSLSRASSSRELLVDRIYSTWSIDAAVLSAIILRNRERTRANQIKLIGNVPDQYFVNLAIAKPHLLITIDRNVDRAIDLVVGSTVRDDYRLNLLDGINSIYGRRFTFANGGLSIGYHSEVARTQKSRIDAEIARIKSKKVAF